MKRRKDQKFLDWISFQPSCLSGRFSEIDDHGRGRCVACHHRIVARGAGTGIKPLYSAYPLLDSEHKMTHQHGLTYYKPLSWWENQADHYYQKWVEECGQKKK